MKARGKVLHSAAAVTGNIGDVANLIKHVAAGKDQNGRQAQARPEAFALYDWLDQGPCRRDDSDEAKREDRRGAESHPVKWPLDLGVRTVGEVAT